MNFGTERMNISNQIETNLWRSNKNCLYGFHKYASHSNNSSCHAKIKTTPLLLSNRDSKPKSDGYASAMISMTTNRDTSHRVSF